jgi:hypothetical protein
MTSTNNIILISTLVSVGIAMLYSNFAPASRMRRIAAVETEARLIASGSCPTCAGKPFENILQNGCTGCFDCQSTGSAKVYLAKR